MSNAVQITHRKAVWRASVCAVAAIFGALVGQTLSAQTTSGSSGSSTDALGIFQGLSADQQQQIMERLGSGNGSSSSTSSPGRPRTSNSSSSSRMTSRIRGARAATKTGSRRRGRIKARRRTLGRRSSKGWIRL